MIALTAEFDLEWPKVLSDFFSITLPVFDVTTSFLSVDCFIDKRSYQNMSVNYEVIDGVLTQMNDDSMIFSENGGVYRSFF